MPLPLQYSSLKAVGSASSESHTAMPGLKGTYDTMSGRHLIDHGVHPNVVATTQPQNGDGIFALMEQPRLSVVPPRFYNVQHQAFQPIEEVLNDRDVLRKIFPPIAASSTAYSSGGHYFDNMAHLTNGTIVKVMPDI